MRGRIVWESAARTAFTRLRKDDPEGTEQVLDRISLLRDDPRPNGVHPYGPDTYRMRVGFYRVLYRIVQEEPVIISVETVGISRRG